MIRVNSMNLRLVVAVAALLGSSYLSAAVTLTVPEEIKIVAVNDQAVNAGLLRKSQDYKLDPGVTKVSVRYNQYFEHLDNTHDIVKSDVVTLTTPELIDGQTYRLGLVNAPKTFEEAQQFKTKPSIAVFNAQNQLLAQQSAVLEAEKSLFGTGLLNKTVDLTTVQAVKPAQVVPTKTVSVQEVKGTTKDVQLIELWKQANSTERQKFMSWLAEQSK